MSIEDLPGQMQNQPSEIAKAVEENFWELFDDEDGTNAPAATVGYEALPNEDAYIIWAALWAGVDNVHAPIDSLTDEQYERASELLEVFDALVDSRAESGDALAKADDT